jgi:uncharacterized protein YxjI
MQRFIIRQKILAITDNFTIRTVDGTDAYFVKGRLISFGDKLVLRNAGGSDRIIIKEKLLRIRPTYQISRNGKKLATINKRLLTLMRDKFKVSVNSEPDLEIVGNIWAHNYRFLRQGKEVAYVSKAWISLTDRYGVQVEDEENALLYLACAIVIDMVCHNTASRPEQ